MILFISLVFHYYYLFYLNYTLLCAFHFFFFFQAEDGIRDYKVTGVQTCALPIYNPHPETLDVTPEESRRNHDGLDVSRRSRKRFGQHSAVFLGERQAPDNQRDAAPLLDASVGGDRAEHVAHGVAWLRLVERTTDCSRVDPLDSNSRFQVLGFGPARLGHHGMIWRDLEAASGRPHLDDLSSLARCDLRNHGLLEIALLERPQPVINTYAPRRLCPLNRIDDLLAWDAQTEEVDVLHDDHLVVLLDEHGAVEDLLHVLSVA